MSQRAAPKVDLVNLLFFTIDIERSAVAHQSLRLPTRPAGRRRSSRLRWLIRGALGLLCATAAGWAGWVVAGGDLSSAALPAWVPFREQVAAAGSGSPARLQIVSQPSGAAVVLDGRSRGSTPLSVSVPQGVHTIVLKHPETIDAQQQVAVGGDLAVNVNLWLRRPAAVQLKPAYPGASLAGAAILRDSRVALTMTVPGPPGSSGSSRLREAWIFDPAKGSLEPFMAEVANPRSPILSASPDGTRLAYVQSATPSSRTDLAGSRSTEVWIASAADPTARMRVFALPTLSSNPTDRSGTANELEEIHDLAWTPDGTHLVVIVRLVGIAGQYAVASRSRLLLVNADPPVGDAASMVPVELLTLPAEVVADSYTWAPDGHWVAFLTEASTGPGSPQFVALCAVDTSAGGAVSGFRYVADLGRQSEPSGPLPVAPMAWSPNGDGRLVYAAGTPRVTISNPLGLPTTSGGEPGLFVATAGGSGLTAEEGQRLGSTTGMVPFGWLGATESREASLLALARSNQGSKPLVLRDLDPATGAPRTMTVALPSGVGGSGQAAARWDEAHGRLLMMARYDNSSSSLLDYWLVQLQAQGGAQ